MKRTALLFILLTAFASLTAAQPKTVTDFYLAFPNDKYAKDNAGKEIKNKTALTKFRKSLIKIEDIKNGYLRLEGAWEGWAEIALFKKTDGNYIIAQAESGCGPVCDGFVKFYTFNAGKWSDMTKQIFPEISLETAVKAFNAKKLKGDEIADLNNFSFYYLLPRQGKTLKIACNECTQSNVDDFVFMEFEWNGAKFIKK